MSRRMPLRVIRESTAGDHAEGGNAPLESEKNGTTSSDSLPETRPPISIRSHIAAQLKGADQDRNGMRIRRSHDASKDQYSEGLQTFQYMTLTELIPQAKILIIGDKGILPVVSEAKSKDPYVSMKGGSLPKFIPARPNRVDDVMTSSFDKGVLTTPGNGNTPLQQTASERAPTYKDAYMPGKRPMGWVGRFNPDLDTAFAPGGIRMSPVPLNVLPPPSQIDRPRPPPMEGLSNFTDAKETVLLRAADRSRNDSSHQHGNQGHVRVVQSRPKPQCWEHGCNGRQFSTFSNLLRHQREKSGQATKVSCPDCGAEFARTTARNGHLLHQKCKHKRQPLTSSNAIDGTKGISSTISKDSSADECVRQARLFADMGERSQKTHNEKDTESISAEPRRNILEFLASNDSRAENLKVKSFLNPYVDDADENGDPIDDTRTYASVVPPGIKEIANASRTRNRTLNRPSDYL
ncbi:hypothetical protein LA080_004745 [Diaporthe eres]|nr:hypothetical protein LA080_004745 [Diaporthe eres]